MTSPDMQSPVGALAPNVINTLQEIIASPIGAEAEEILAALAQFGDSLVARFFRGYTSVTDIFAHAFDELGAELGGIPGMSGVTAWVSSIEELISTAMGLIEEVFNGVTGIVDGLSFAVTGQGVEGNIASGMHQVVEGLTVFLKLVNLAMDLIQELIDGVLGVAGGTMHQLVQVLSWVIQQVNNLLLVTNGLYDGFMSIIGLGVPSGRPIEDLVAGLTGFLGGLLPKTDFGGFLNLVKDKASGTTGSTGTTPVQAANALELLRGVAEGAAQDAENAIETAVQTITDGMKNLGSAAAPVQNALNTFIDLIFGSGTSSGSTPTVRWSQEVLLAAGPVVVGQNDLPLGFGSPFPAVITSISMVSSEHLSTGAGSKVVVQTRRNGAVIHTATWNGGNNAYSSGSLNLAGIQNGDRITFNVSEASSQMANMSITIAGKYS